MGTTAPPVEDQCFGYDSLSRAQSWTFDSLGDIATQTSHAPAGNTKGDTTSTYHYAAAGHAHAVSSITAANTVSGNQPTVSYTYNAAGTTKTMGNQSMTWNPNGKLSAAGTSTAPSSYTYGADGQLLVQDDTSGTTTTTTLYLPGEQLTTNGSTTTGVRYYSFAGIVISETTPTTLYWLTGTAQGTMTTAVTAATETTIIRRAATPYGTPLTGSGTWPDDRTFLGDPHDAATGLIALGARQYDPATGLFLSPDPVLNLASPQTMASYTYAAADPVIHSDPTGLFLPAEGGGCPSSEMGCPGYSGSTVAASQPAAVQQSYNGFVSEYTDSGHIHAAPWIRWKALWNACSYTHACGTGIGNVADFEASTTYTQHRNQQIAEPKAPLWEVLLSPYVAAGVAVAGVSAAGPAYDAAYALSVRVSAWWLTLGAGGGAAATEADGGGMSGSGGYDGTTAKVGKAFTITWGDAQFAKTENINFYLSEVRDASEDVSQTANGLRTAFAAAQPVASGPQPVASAYVNDPVTPAIYAFFGMSTALSQSSVPQWR